MGSKFSHNPGRQASFSCLLMDRVRLGLTCTQLIMREEDLLCVLSLHATAAHPKSSLLFPLNSQLRAHVHPGSLTGFSSFSSRELQVNLVRSHSSGKLFLVSVPPKPCWLMWLTSIVGVPCYQSHQLAWSKCIARAGCSGPRSVSKASD